MGIPNILLVIATFAIVSVRISQVRAQDPKAFLAKINKEYQQISNKLMLANWNSENNPNSEALAEIASEATTELGNWQKKMYKELQTFPWEEIEDENLKRQFFKFSQIGEAALPEKLYEEYIEIQGEASGLYGSQICEFKNPDKCDLSIDPELVDIMAKSHDPEALKYYWLAWHNATGEQLRPIFPRMVELGNKAARLNGKKDKSEIWLQEYETCDFERQIESCWKEIKPLYEQLHAYVRHRLRNKYKDAVSVDGPIPAQLLGNMWAQLWDHVADFTLPFPEKKPPNVTSAMIEQGYDAAKIFNLVELDFADMGMSPLTKEFWDKSIIEEPKDRDISCVGSTWDFYDGKDFRLKQCTKIDEESLREAYKKIGQIQYFIQYKDLPVAFRGAANPGFNDAIGDLIVLSASSPTHLQKLQLLEDGSIDDEASLNHLYKMALIKIAFLPFAYVQDLWRYKVFRGKISPDDYNCQWWELTEKYQGIEPPVHRSEKNFDPAALVHVLADAEYLNYYVATIIEFQFHKALCIEAGEYNPNNPKSKPLHECDIIGNKRAGNRLKAMMKLGSSKPWPNAMEAITGQRKMSSSGILDYFKPLMKWLTAENKKNKVRIGWKESKKLKDCSSPVEEMLEDGFEFISGMMSNLIKRVAD